MQTHQIFFKWKVANTITSGYNSKDTLVATTIYTGCNLTKKHLSCNHKEKIQLQLVKESQVIATFDFF
jgi:hypothetical protein